MSADRGRGDTDPPDGLVPTRVVVARRRSWTVPVIIVVALALATIGFLGQKPVPPRPPVEPTPTPVPIAIDWTPIPLDPEAFRGALVGLVIGGSDGLLAIGQSRTDRHPITWTSADGQAWVRHDQAPRTFGGGVPDLAAQVGPTFVAVGYHATADGVSRDIWNSSDGATWTRDPSPSGRGYDDIRALVGARGTAILVGSTRGREVLLASGDGRVWTEAAGLDAALDRQPFIADTIDAGDGYVAVGSIGSESAIWRSPDGRTWTPVTPFVPSGVDIFRFERVLRTTAGLVALASSDAVAGGPSWNSPDGVTWTQDTTSTIRLADLDTVLVPQGANVGVPYDLSGGGPGALTVWTDPATSFSTPGPTTGPTEWRRQATVVDGRIVLLAQDSATDAIDGWLGTIVGSGADVGSPSPAATAGADASARPSPVPIPIPTPLVVRPENPSGTPIEWSRVTSPQVLGDAVRQVSMAGVANVDGGLVGYGSEGTDGAIWRASDAGRWERMPLSPAMRGAVLRAVAQGRGVLVAVGGILGPDGQESPAAWTSPDGRIWLRRPVSPNPANGEIGDVVAGPDGFVSVGWRDSDQGSVATVWRSADGSAWDPVPGLRDDTSSTMQAVARSGAGYIAVGTIQSNGPAIGAAWVSADGRTWTSVADQVAFELSVGVTGRFGGMAVNDVVAGGPGFVAVGAEEGATGPVGRIFTSRDGRSWTRLPSDPMLDGAYLRTVVPWAGGLVAAGDISDFGGSRPVIYASTDGVVWTPIARADLDPGRLDAPGDASLGGLTALGPDLLAVGTMGSYPALQGVIWVGAPVGEVVPDHVCPTKVDSLVVLASMTDADRAACLRDRNATVEALVRANEGGCTGGDVPDDLSGCAGNLELAPIGGGPSLLTTPIDRTLIGSFPTTGFARWALTFRAGVTSPACVPSPSVDGVIYQPLDSIRLQCLGVLRLIRSVPIARP